LYAAEIIVIGDKAALITGDAGINGKKFDNTSAVGTDLFVDGGSTGLSLATFH
jgi:hypothetical protein